MNKIEITPELLSELKEKAEKATPGPWEAIACIVALPEQNNKQAILGGFFDYDDVENNRFSLGQGNAAFIALANPQLVLALIAEIEHLRRDIEFQTTAMSEYKQVAKMAWGGEIPSPLPGHESSEEKMVEQFEYLNCPCCGGSGHVGDCDGAIQNLKCDIEKLRKENEELHANNYGPEILNDPQALTTAYFAGEMAEGRRKNVENDKLQAENDKLKAVLEMLNEEADWLAQELAGNVVPKEEWRMIAHEAVKKR